MPRSIRPPHRWLITCNPAMVIPTTSEKRATSNLTTPPLQLREAPTFSKQQHSGTIACQLRTATPSVPTLPCNRQPPSVRQLLICKTEKFSPPISSTCTSGLQTVTFPPEGSICSPRNGQTASRKEECQSSSKIWAEGRRPKILLAASLSPSCLRTTQYAESSLKRASGQSCAKGCCPIAPNQARPRTTTRVCVPTGPS